MHRQDILNYLRNHHTRFMEEAVYVRRSIEYIEKNPDAFERSHGPIHVTASAWVVNPGRNRVLMVHHGKLHQWFQPGGHADGDTDVLRIAMKEVSEESGINESKIQLVMPEVFDVDMHLIPASAAPEAHGHIDIRFLVEIDDSLPVPGSDESHEVRWVELKQVTSYNNNLSTRRMMEKTRQMRRSMAA